MIDIILQLHGGKGSSSTTVQAYEPTTEERQAVALQNDYVQAIMPNAKALNTSAANMFFNSLGDTQVDYASLLNQAQQQNNAANAGYSSLANGTLPSNYVQNMTDAISSGVQNTMGSTLNSLASRGVLNSSVTNTAMNDISKNVSDTMAQQYSNNIEQLSNIYGNMANNAGTNISLASAAQEAAQEPAINAWNMSLGLGNSGNSTLSALAGKGTTTSTTANNSSSNWGSTLTALGSAYLSCFTKDTLITMADGTKKPIADIKVGDEVSTYDDTLDDIAVGVVEAVSKPVINGTCLVVCTNENNHDTSVTTTLTQPFLTDDKGFVDVANLHIGDRVKGVGRVTTLAMCDEQKVYDIKVSGTNNYFANGFIAYGMFPEQEKE